jgi:hypothetical protein
MLQGKLDITAGNINILKPLTEYKADIFYYTHTKLLPPPGDYVKMPNQKVKREKIIIKTNFSDIEDQTTASTGFYDLDGK